MDSFLQSYEMMLICGSSQKSLVISYEMAGQWGPELDLFAPF